MSTVVVANQNSNRGPERRTWCILTCLLWCLFLSPVPAKESATTGAGPDSVYVEPKNYSPLWVGRNAVVTAEEIAATVVGLKKQEPNPDHIVVFIHGFNLRREASTAEFDRLAKNLRTELTSSQANKVAFAGVQWASASESSVFELANVYWQKISVARSVGRGPTRQLLLAIHKAFPKAHVSVMAHSMGCEVAAAAIIPEMVYDDQVPFVPTYQPEADVMLNLVTFCGSDLDYDIWSKSGVEGRSLVKRNRMLWQTVAPNDKGKKDRVLSYRARLRGKAAGASFPKMTVQQLETVLGQRRIILDTEAIPSDHDLEKYYDQDRLARIVATMLYVANPKRVKPPEIGQIDEIMAEPDHVKSLLPHLDSPHVGTLFYTLWRIERLNCGDARHLTDGTLEAIVTTLREKPQMVWREAPKSECLTIKNEQFPTVTQMTRSGAPPRARKR
jgi:esterase/lipase superfamily enzyme